ncbi:hypothetical protein Saro_2494 [Novosphingobium aromaticivorans DSM 12444]|uniref:Secreted protein n=1 Tax=Novosphingobium aromaticivorans (strain ATCC 700278 / DSM 12444 / CCUG 56034 / CIP 105152 / NBRC 16084 / F199) TaxID=279238 RepID=Q2G5E3_NOVAD|nr:hypothetical protein Saro_2494 [Novosphingobium aromaticivorans DSM 12444]
MRWVKRVMSKVLMFGSLVVRFAGLSAHAPNIAGTVPDCGRSRNPVLSRWPEADCRFTISNTWQISPCLGVEVWLLHGAMIAACNFRPMRISAPHPDIVKARSGWLQTVPARTRFCPLSATEIA